MRGGEGRREEEVEVKSADAKAFRLLQFLSHSMAVIF